MELSKPDSLPAVLRTATTQQNLTAGQVLFHQKGEAHAVFVVEQGRIKPVRYTNEGKLVIFQVARPADSFGELALFSDNYSCDAVAEIPSRVIVYPKQLLLSVLRDYPDLAEDYIQRLQCFEVSRLS